MVSEVYFQSVLQTLAESMHRNVSIRISTLGRESLITRARNTMVKDFLESDATHLFFVDADMGFTAQDFFALVDADKDVVVGACPVKEVNLNKLMGKSFDNLQDIEYSVVRYALNPFFASQEDRLKSNYSVEDGLVEVTTAGAAFMCIKREVIEKMILAHPELSYKNENGERCFAIFDTMIRGSEYLSEDYAFCQRWRDLGGKVFLHPQVAIDHFGAYTFKAVPFSI